MCSFFGFGGIFFFSFFFFFFFFLFPFFLFFSFFFFLYWVVLYCLLFSGNFKESPRCLYSFSWREPHYPALLFFVLVSLAIFRLFFMGPIPLYTPGPEESSCRVSLRIRTRLAGWNHLMRLYVNLTNRLSLPPSAAVVSLFIRSIENGRELRWKEWETKRDRESILVRRSTFKREKIVLAEAREIVNREWKRCVMTVSACRKKKEWEV